MSHFDPNEMVGEVVSRRPELARVFEELGIDYCCGGRRSLEKACVEADIDPNQLLSRLAEASKETPDSRMPSPSTMTLTDLADHIEKTHHAYFRAELPRLVQLTETVARVHGDRNSRLRELRSTLLSLNQELFSHLLKEEQVLFPMIRLLEASDKMPEFHCGSISNPLRQMEFEHDSAGTALDRVRELSDGYEPPDWACNTYRAMLDALAKLERDLYQHIHKENNILFPRAERMEMEAAKGARSEIFDSFR